MLKKIGLALATIAVSIGLFTITGAAQPGKAKWRGNNGNHKGWSMGNHKGWDNGRKEGWRWKSRHNHDRRGRHDRRRHHH